MMGPLAGVRIADFSVRSYAAGVATMLLADLGATVLRVPPSTGDPLAELPATRVWWSGQSTVARAELDLSTVDVLLDTAHARREPTHWGARPPRQIRALLTAEPWFPDEGEPPADRAVYGELAEAEYGLMHLQDGVRPNPVFLAWPHACFGAGWLLAIGITAALYERERSGLGQVVTTSLLDGLAILSTSRWIGGERLDRLNQPRSTIGRVGDERAIISLFQCSDGRWINVHTGPRGAFDRLMAILGLSDLVPPEAGAGLFGRPLAPDVAERMWVAATEKFLTRPSREWVDELSAADICAMPCLRPGEILELPQVVANELSTVDEHGLGRVHRWARFARTPLRSGLSDTPVGDPAAGQDSLSAPLFGVTVVDLGIFMAGPFGARILADLGARVVKVEEIAGDPMRFPLGAFSGVQRGKQSIALDLKSAEGAAVMRSLLARADVFISNLRRGALARLGLAPDAVAAVNDRMVYCHTSGYGNAGPWRDLPAFEPLHSALCGLLVRTGGEGNPPKHYLAHMDFGCGLTAATAILAALYERERSGRGQHVEMPQLAAGLVAMSDVHLSDGQVVDSFPLDADLLGHAPTNGLYHTADGWLVVACGDEVEWQGLRAALRIEDDWPSYVDARRTGRNASPADEIARRFAELSTVDALAVLTANGVPAAEPREVESPHVDRERVLTDNGIIVADHHPEIGDMFEVGHTLRFSRTTGTHRRPAPTLDEHRTAVLRDLAGVDA